MKDSEKSAAIKRIFRGGQSSSKWFAFIASLQIFGLLMLSIILFNGNKSDVKPDDDPKTNALKTEPASTRTEKVDPLDLSNQNEQLDGLIRKFNTLSATELKFDDELRAIENLKTSAAGAKTEIESINKIDLSKLLAEESDLSKFNSRLTAVQNKIVNLKVQELSDLVQATKELYGTEDGTSGAGALNKLAESLKSVDENIQKVIIANDELARKLEAQKHNSDQGKPKDRFAVVFFHTNGLTLTQQLPIYNRLKSEFKGQFVAIAVDGRGVSEFDFDKHDPKTPYVIQVSNKNALPDSCSEINQVVLLIPEGLEFEDVKATKTETKDSEKDSSSETQDNSKTNLPARPPSFLGRGFQSTNFHFMCLLYPDGNIETSSLEQCVKKFGSESVFFPVIFYKLEQREKIIQPNESSIEEILKRVEQVIE